MASDVEQLILSVSADTRQIQRALSRLTSDSARTTKQIEGNFNSMTRSVGGSFAKLGDLFKTGFGGVVAGVGVASAVQAFIGLSDASTRITNSLKVAGLEGKNLSKTYSELARVAKENGAEFESLASLYSRVTINSKQLGVSQQQIGQFVERMAQGLRASGTDAQAASDGIRQLTQALASGVLRGDEFNSVMENLPVVARAIADGLGVTTGQLRKMAEAGQLTAKTVFDAFIKGSSGFAEQAGKTQLTFSQAFTNITTALIEAAGKFNELTGAAEGVAKAINTVAIGIGLVADAMDKLSSNPAAMNILKTLAETAIGGPLAMAHDLATASSAPTRSGPPSDPNSESMVVRRRGQVEAMHKAAELAAKAHTVAVKETQEAYGKLAERIVGARTEVDNLIQQVDRENPDAADALYDSYKKLLEGIYATTLNAEDLNKVIEDLRATGTDTGNALADSLEQYKQKLVEAAEQTKQHGDAMAQLGQIITQNVVSALQQALDLLNKMAPSTSQWVQALQAASQIVNTVQGQLAQFPAFATPGGLGGVSGVPGGLTPQGLTFNTTEAKQFLKTRSATKQIQDRIDYYDDQTATALAHLLTILGPGAKIISGVRTREEQAKLYADYKSGKGGLAAAPGHSRHEKGMAADIGGVSPEALKAAIAQQSQLETLSGHAYEIDKMHVQLAGEKLSVSDLQTEATKKQSTALDDWLKKSEEAVALKQKENAIDADYTATANEKDSAKEREKLIQEGLNAVMEQYGTISDANRQKVYAAADAQVKLGLTAANAADAQRKAAEAAKDQAQAAQEFGQQIAGVLQGAVSGLISDLRNGVDAGEAFTNMLNRMIDGLIDMALQALFSQKALGSLFSNMFGGGGGGGFSFATGGGGLYHGGGTVGMSGRYDGRRFPAALWNDAPRMHRGGVVSGLRPGEVPVVLRKGEVVLPQVTSLKSAAMQQAPVRGNITNNIGDVSVDMSGTGLVASSTESGKLLGRHIQAAVEVVLVRESRPGGILRRQGTA